VSRHGSEAAFLWQLRNVACVAPHWTLEDLAELDERLEAHLDGLRVVGENGWRLTERQLEAGAGEVFVACVLALESRDLERIARVVKEAAKSDQSRTAIDSAFARVPPRILEGIIKTLLGSASATGRTLGIRACVAHGVSPGSALPALLGDADQDVRASTARACGQLGLSDHLPALLRLGSEAGASSWASWSSVVLGHRDSGLDALVRTGITEPRLEPDAFRLALMALDVPTAHRALQMLVGDPSRVRWLIEGSGLVGDPAYVPWLIAHMRDETKARLAGEVFGLISGAQLSALQLDRSRPDGFQGGPNDDPNDQDVAVDPDEGLPWPDPERVKGWWEKNGARFQPGHRYFVGAPVTREHCINVLKTGYQRQRILAAHYLCLLEPGTPLFNTSAPAWRQQRLLAQMS
jgi:uncharacterized protein (TIGR02270 family)